MVKNQTFDVAASKIKKLGFRKNELFSQVEDVVVTIWWETSFLTVGEPAK